MRDFQKNGVKMKGQSEFTQTFIKLIQIALVMIGALSIYFTYVSYEITVHSNDANREAYILGNALMSSSCLTDGTKGLLIESKINSLTPNDPAKCINYPNGNIEIKWGATTKPIDIGSATAGKSAEFDILIKLDVTGGGAIEEGKMTVSV